MSGARDGEATRGGPRLRGPWSAERIQAHLASSVIPLRLACAEASGWPLVLSLWVLPQDGALWCATHAGARVARLLARDPRCAFELAADAPPYRGVRGRGRATLLPERGEEILRALLQRYLGGTDSGLARWLLSRAAEEVAIRIEPRVLVSWDYSARMQAR